MAVNLPDATPDHVLVAAQMNQQPMHVDHLPNDQSPLDPDIIAYMGDFPIRESSKRTMDLVGGTFVQSSGLEYQGRKALMFVFSVRIVDRMIYGVRIDAYSHSGSSCKDRRGVHIALPCIQHILPSIWGAHTYTCPMLRGALQDLPEQGVPGSACLDEPDQGKCAVVVASLNC